MEGARARARARRSAVSIRARLSYGRNALTRARPPPARRSSLRSRSHRSPMKRSRCPSSVAQPFNTPAAAGGAPRLGGGGAPTGAGPSEGGFGLKKQRASKMIARALVRTAAKDDERPDDAPVEAADKAPSPRQPLGPVKVAVGQPASSSTRKAFKPPIKKDSEMADMYGQSSKVPPHRRSHGSDEPPLLTPAPPLRVWQSLGGRPAPARQARYSPHLEGALVLYTPPPETCSEDVPPPCATASNPGPSPAAPPLTHTRAPPAAAGTATSTSSSTRTSRSSCGRISARASRCASPPARPAQRPHTPTHPEADREAGA